MNNINIMKNRLIFLFFCFVTLLFSSRSDAQDLEKLPNDTRWVTQSLEYKAICKQTYIMAWRSMRNKLRNIEQPVIIMDLDETVLDNSQYQVELFQKAKKFNLSSWNKWVKKEVSKLVPGSKEFI